MGLLVRRTRKDESGRALLEASSGSNYANATINSNNNQSNDSGNHAKRGGFLGIRRRSPAARRSDNPGDTKTGLSSAPHWAKVRSAEASVTPGGPANAFATVSRTAQVRTNPPIRTPPLTPLTPVELALSGGATTAEGYRHNPINDYVTPQAPVPDVTLRRGSAQPSTPHGAVHTTTPLTATTLYSFAPNSQTDTRGLTDPMPHDEQSEYSDLTDNRTQQRLMEQREAYERFALRRKPQEVALAEAQKERLPGKDHSYASPPHRNESTTTAEPPNPAADGDDSNFFFADFLGLIDRTCKPVVCNKTARSSCMGEGEHDDKSYYSSPEWGLAPSKDTAREMSNRSSKKTLSALRKRDIHKNAHLRHVSSALADTASVSEDDEGSRGVATREDYEDDEEEDDEEEDDDVFSDVEQSEVQTRVPNSPKCTHENFEMVLEECDEEEFLPRRRPPWIKNPFQRGRRTGDQEYIIHDIEEHPVETGPISAPDKAHQDMVKQALFPDYETPVKQAPVASHEEVITTRVSPLLRPQYHEPPPSFQPPMYQEKTEVPEHEETPQRHSSVRLSPPPTRRGGTPLENEDGHNDDDFVEESKEAIHDYGQEVPLKTTTNNNVLAKKRIGNAIFGSFRRRSRIKDMPTLEPVQEDRPSTATGVHFTSTSGFMHHSPLIETIKNVRRGLARNRSDEKTNSSRSSGETNQDKTNCSRSSGETHPSSGQKSFEDEAVDMIQLESIGSGRITPLVQAMNSKDHSEENPGSFVGGFMAMISETVASVQGGNPIPQAKAHSDQMDYMQQSMSWTEGGSRTQSNNMQAARTNTSEKTPDFSRTNSTPPNVGDKQIRRRKQIWREVKDPASGRPYYYHRITRETTWTRPAEMDAPLSDGSGHSQLTVTKTRVSADESSMGPNPSPIQSSDSTEKKLQQLRQTRGSLQTGTDSIQKSSSHGSAGNQFVELLRSMVPAGGTGIESLMAQYEGRENELLEHVRLMNDSRPFDEPLATDHNEEGIQLEELQVPSPMRIRAAPTSSFSRTTSGITSRQSELTQLMKNTNSFLSTEETPQVVSEQRIPTKIPVPSVRSRDLRVEEFSQERYKFETFKEDTRGIPHKEPAPRIRNSLFSIPYGMTTAAAAATIEEEEPNDADSSHANDTISALSLNELEFIQPATTGGPDEIRRRALDDAIRREDWDMAVSISEKMKDLRAKDEGAGRRHKREEWKQSELDKFISENDWDAVSEYIAQLRLKSNTESVVGTSRKPRGVPRMSKGEESGSSGTSSKDRRSHSLNKAITEKYADPPRRGVVVDDGVSSRRRRSITRRSVKNPGTRRSQRLSPSEQSYSSEVSEDYEEDYEEEEESYYDSTESSSSAPARPAWLERRSQQPSQRKQQRHHHSSSNNNRRAQSRY